VKFDATSTAVSAVAERKPKGTRFKDQLELPYTKYPEHFAAVDRAGERSRVSGLWAGSTLAIHFLFRLPDLPLFTLPLALQPDSIQEIAGKCWMTKTSSLSSPAAESAQEP
jgi:hypothetical protein